MAQVQMLQTQGAIGISILISFSSKDLLIDAGDGTLAALAKHDYDYNRLSAILISHEHFDHIMGLPALLAGMRCAGKNTPLTIFHPTNPIRLPSLLNLYRQYEFRHPEPPIELLSYHPNQLYSHSRINITPFSCSHRGPCCGFILHSVNEGSPQKIVISSDTIPCPALETALKDADIAVLEAGFPGGYEQIAHAFHHTTEKEALDMTQKVPQVYLYHRLPIGHIREYLEVQRP